MNKTVTIAKNHFTDGKHYADLYKCAGNIYEVRYYTKDSEVQIKAYPSKSSAMQFIKYFVEV